MRNLKQRYYEFLKEYSPQGWWPLLDLHTAKGKDQGTNPTKTGSIKGYHPGDYSYPKTEKQQFEICIGAILTQNTAWQNVEKALVNLNVAGILSPEAILKTDSSKLAALIKPAGYFNQKAKKLKEFATFFIALNGNAPSREQLLEVWGIGPETADSILLYAYKVPTFVVDAYTRRIFKYDKSISYDQIKSDFEKSIPQDYKIYQEYHALIVEHAKRIL